MSIPSPFASICEKQATLAESVLNEHLRKLPYKFVFQHQIGEACVDFCCRSHRLVIEVDGDSHENKTEQDADRDKCLRDQNYQVLRFRNDEVLEQTERVLDEIFRVCESRPQWRY